VLRVALGPATDAGCDHLGLCDRRGVGYAGAAGQVPGVDRAAGDANVEMHMRPMGAAGVANLADRLARRVRGSWGDAQGESLHMGVAGDHAVGVLDVDDIALSVIAPGVDHGAAGGGEDGGALGRHHVQTGVAMREAAGDVFELGGRVAHLAAEGLRLGGERKEGEKNKEQRAHDFFGMVAIRTIGALTGP
jgi:hypothetical protein